MFTNKCGTRRQRTFPGTEAKRSRTKGGRADGPATTSEWGLRKGKSTDRKMKSYSERSRRKGQHS